MACHSPYVLISFFAHSPCPHNLCSPNWYNICFEIVCLTHHNNWSQPTGTQRSFFLVPSLRIICNLATVLLLNNLLLFFSHIYSFRIIPSVRIAASSVDLIWNLAFYLYPPHFNFTQLLYLDAPVLSLCHCLYPFRSICYFVVVCLCIS